MDFFETFRIISFAFAITNIQFPPCNVEIILYQVVYNVIRHIFLDVLYYACMGFHEFLCYGPTIVGVRWGAYSLVTVYCIGMGWEGR